jgi:hypothetical protein
MTLRGVQCLVLIWGNLVKYFFIIIWQPCRLGISLRVNSLSLSLSLSFSIPLSLSLSLSFSLFLSFSLSLRLRKLNRSLNTIVSSFHREIFCLSVRLFLSFSNFHSLSLSVCLSFFPFFLLFLAQSLCKVIVNKR